VKTPPTFSDPVLSQAPTALPKLPQESIFTAKEKDPPFSAVISDNLKDQ
jgi:hypothetical protein